MIYSSQVFQRALGFCKRKQNMHRMAFEPDKFCSSKDCRPKLSTVQSTRVQSPLTESNSKRTQPHSLTQWSESTPPRKYHIRHQLVM